MAIIDVDLNPTGPAVVVVGLPSSGNRMLSMGLVASGAVTSYHHADNPNSIEQLHGWMRDFGGGMIVLRRIGWVESFARRGHMPRLDGRTLTAYVADWEREVMRAHDEFDCERMDVTYERILEDPPGQLRAIQERFGLAHADWPMEIKAGG